jgi:hypothetical protein
MHRRTCSSFRKAFLRSRSSASSPGGVAPFDLPALIFQKFAPLFEGLHPCRQGLAPRRDLAQLRQQRVAPLHKAPVGQKRIQHPALIRRRQQALLPVLAGMPHQARAQVAHSLLRAQGVVDEQAAAPGGPGQLAADDQLAAVRALLVEQGLDHRAVLAGADHVRLQPVAQQKAQRPHDETFARAGLARKHVQPGGEFQLQVLDEREVMYAQKFQHGSPGPHSIRAPGQGQGPPAPAPGGPAAPVPALPARAPP